MTATAFDLDRARLDAAATLRPEHFEEFQRLAKTLLHGPPFQLLFVECGDAGYRDRLIAALDGPLRMARLQAQRLPLSRSVRDAAALEVRMRRQAKQAQVVHVVGGAAWFDALRWEDLNQRRERLAQEARARFVLWLDAPAIAEASKRAIDLWAWRGGVYAFEAVVGTALVAPPGTFLPTTRKPDIDSRSMAERHRRVAELRRLVASHFPDDLKILALDELGRLLYELGRYDEALQHWQEVELPFHRRSGDERGVAITLGKIADVLETRGQLDEALRVRREDQLPVFEKLGDQRERAVTMGQIADVLQARGQLDEALRIRREEELPVYEKLGDELARAATMGQIADVLQARGQLDEALRIRQEEELPVYERLGDRRARAVTMGQIADVLQMRGQLDEALRIRREEQLPVYEKLGDQRARAITLGQIAHVLQERGQFDEALRIERDEELPVYEKLGLIRDQAICRWRMALAHIARGAQGDREEARHLLQSALDDANRLHLPEAERLADALRGLE